jgi:hypothetical protein
MVKALRDSGKPVWYINALSEVHCYSKKKIAIYTSKQ